jgi:hypothetical protein
MNLFFTIYFAFRTVLVPCPFCNSKTELKIKSNIEKAGELPSVINESSGLYILDTLRLTVNDSGGDPVVYGLDKDLNLVKTFPFAGYKNHDWEALSGLGDSIIFIGDFGNNKNSRKNLYIIRYDVKKTETTKISFHFEDQKEFPPLKKKHRNYDCEAMVPFKDSILLFSKNRGKKNMKIYSVPDKQGEHKAIVKNSYKINEMITDAAIMPENQMVALLCYGKIIFYRVKNTNGTLCLEPVYCRRFIRARQSEAIAFIDNGTLLITNEQGKVYRMKLSNK